MKTNRQITRDEASHLDLPTRINLEMRLTDADAAKTKMLSAFSEWEFDQYRNKSPWRTFLFDFLGPITNKTILDLGCGYNPTAIYFAKAGARRVYACDVSPQALAHVRELAEAAGVADRVSVFLCAGEQLALSDETVDIIHGEAVLHHLLLPLAGAELGRVLKNAGKAGFKDPLGQNPLLEFARDYLPYYWKASAKGTDRPLTFSNIKEFGLGFSEYTYRGFGLLSIIATYIWGRGNSRPRKIADILDRYLLHWFPVLQGFCRFVVTCAVK